MKKMISMFLIMFMFVFSVMPAYAVGAGNMGEQSGVSPLFTYIYSISKGLSIDSSGKSTSLGGASTYSSYQTINVNVQLQKSSGSTWTTIKSWSVSGPGDPGVETVNDYYVVSGTYRVCVTAKAYDASGNLLETQSVYSATKTY